MVVMEENGGPPVQTGGAGDEQDQQHQRVQQWYDHGQQQQQQHQQQQQQAHGGHGTEDASGRSSNADLADAYFKQSAAAAAGQHSYFSQMQQHAAAYQGQLSHGANANVTSLKFVPVCINYRIDHERIVSLLAQSQMMSRHPAGSFYPLHSMWGTFTGGAAAAAAKQYSSGFPGGGYAKDRSDHEGHENGNGTAAAAHYSGDLHHQTGAGDFKPPAESLIPGLTSTASDYMTSSSSLVQSQTSRKHQEGTTTNSSNHHSSTSSSDHHHGHHHHQPGSTPVYPYYSSTQDLSAVASMYGSRFGMGSAASALAATAKSSRPPKQKARSNAGKKSLLFPIDCY